MYVHNCLSLRQHLMSLDTRTPTRLLLLLPLFLPPHTQGMPPPPQPVADIIYTVAMYDPANKSLTLKRAAAACGTDTGKKFSKIQLPLHFTI